MGQLTLPKLIYRRLVEDWPTLLSVLIGVTSFVTLSAASPLYLDSLEQLAFNNSLDRASSRFLSFDIFGANVAMTRPSFEAAENSITSAVERHVSEAYQGRELYFRAEILLVGLPDQPLPARRGTGEPVARGYFQLLSNLGDHARFVEGRMAQDDAAVLEAVISAPTAQEHGLMAGDTVVVTQDLGREKPLSALIVGVLEPDDRLGQYWGRAAVFLDPAPIDEPPPRVISLTGSPDEDPPRPVALFVTERGMLDVVAPTYRSGLVNPIWFIPIDKGAFKGWSVSEVLRRASEFEAEISRALPGSSVSTGLVRGLVESVTQQSFYTRVPLLLLLALMLSTVLFFLTMVAGYLVQSRGRDSALFRTRGVGMFRLQRIYGGEGLIIAGVSVVLAVPLAYGLVTFAGKLPYFREMTGGALLPVRFELSSLVVALAAGLLCLVILMMAGASGSRGGLLVFKLQSARPPALSFFHRYYVDVALVIFGGVMFWEMRSRGQIISRGLFGDVEINEALLLAPVLFLIVVALAFLRLFPLVVRFVSGESVALVHLASVAVFVAWVAAMVTMARSEEEGASWLLPTVLVIAVAGAYWATSSAGRARSRTVGLAVQATLALGLVAAEGLHPEEVTFWPIVALLSIVPAQLAFLLLRASIRKAPIWLTMGLWRLARSPLQYTWLVLLLVLVTGLAVLSTTVGGTLERSQVERIRYRVGADLRIRTVPEHLVGGMRGLKERHESIPGVEAASLALRTRGNVGSASVEVLAVETEEFLRIAWYREDFSDVPLRTVMESMQSFVEIEPILVPDGATEIGAWIKPGEGTRTKSLWFVLRDSVGQLKTVSLGNLGEGEWHLATAEIPDGLKPPLGLVSVQIFEPGSFAADITGSSPGTPGILLLDDIHARLPGGEAATIEGFEEPNGWTPILTLPDSTAVLKHTSQDRHEGQSAGLFSYGGDRNKLVRGFYRSATGGTVPVVLSRSLMEANGFGIGDAVLARIDGITVPIEVRGAVDLFPTMKREGEFILADLDILLGYLNIFGYPSQVRPNELYVGKTADAGPRLDDLIDQLAAQLVRVEDGDSELQAVLLNPLVSAGWRAIVLLSLAVVLVASVFGYATYLMLFANRSRGEMGFLQSLGMSRWQRLGLLGFEHLTIAMIGLGLGTWAGTRMSQMMVSPLATTEFGKPVMPPFIMMTDWTLMGPTYIVLIAVFLASLAVLNRGAGRTDLHAIARMGDV